MVILFVTEYARLFPGQGIFSPSSLPGNSRHGNGIKSWLLKTGNNQEWQGTLKKPNAGNIPDQSGFWCSNKDGVTQPVRKQLIVSC